MAVGAYLNHAEKQRSSRAVHIDDSERSIRQLLFRTLTYTQLWVKKKHAIC